MRCILDMGMMMTERLKTFRDLMESHDFEQVFKHGRLEERAKVAAFFRKHNREQYAKAIENGEHDQ